MDATSIQDPPTHEITDTDSSSADTPASEEDGEIDPIIESIELIYANNDPLSAKKRVQKIMRRLRWMEEYAIIRDIKALYDLGVPLFTKERIREIKGQLEEITQINCIPSTMGVIGIDDTLIEVELTDDYPLVDNWEWKWREQTLIRSKKSLVTYRPIQRMTNSAPRGWPFDPETAYLSLGGSWRYNYVSCGVEDDPATCKFSAAKLEQMFRDKKKEWEATHEYDILRTLVAVNPGFTRVRKVIGVALGALVYGGRASEKLNQRSLAQYSLLLSMRELIANMTESDDIQCLAQDPELTPAAVEALRRVGITVLNDPDAFLELDYTSMLICMCPTIPVRQIVADIARPAAIFWDEDIAGDSEDEELAGDPSSTRVDTMIQNEYVKLGFPQYRLFAPAVLYIRKK